MKFRKIATKGDKNRGEEVIALLESYGGNNYYRLIGTITDAYYYIGEDGSVLVDKFPHEGYELIDLPDDIKPLSQEMILDLSNSDTTTGSEVDELRSKVKELESKLSEIQNKDLVYYVDYGDGLHIGLPSGLYFEIFSGNSIAVALPNKEVKAYSSIKRLFEDRETINNILKK